MEVKNIEYISNTALLLEAGETEDNWFRRRISNNETEVKAARGGFISLGAEII